MPSGVPCRVGANGEHGVETLDRNQLIDSESRISDQNPAKTLGCTGVRDTAVHPYGVNPGDSIAAKLLDTLSGASKSLLSPDATIPELLKAVVDTLLVASRRGSDSQQVPKRIKGQATSFSQLVDLVDSSTHDVSSLYYAAKEVWGHSVSQPKRQKILRPSTVLELGIEGQPLSSCKYDPTIPARQKAQSLLLQLDEISYQFSDPTLGLSLNSISRLSYQEFAQIREWNASLPSRANTCVHDTIELWAQLQPSAEAICAWDRRISYAELDELSSRLASYLSVSCDVTLEEPIPLYMPRSALAVVSMLGVLKSGGTFVPLDPANPRRRNEHIVEQSGARKILTSCSDCIFAEKAVHVSWKFLDGLASPCRNLLPTVSLSNLAYIIFTSGSTGQPKGVMIEHGSLSTSLQAHSNEIYDQNTTSRVLQFASLAFDASMTEHLAPLSNGACVCIPDQETRMGNIVGFINTYDVNWAFFTPSFFKFVDPQEVPGLKAVVLGGEAITDDCIDKWASKIKLINGYGPSETTIVATACTVDPLTKSRSSIGKGLACRTWVVDTEDHTQLVPLGTTGELLIQGPTVGRGYLNDSVKTKAAFVEIPWWGQYDDWTKSQRIYKTGDLVKYEEDGGLTYLGRKDTQVKIRGQRLELSEVEYHISLTHSIQHVAAFAPKSGLYKGRLVTVITCGSSESPSTTNNIQLLSNDAARKADAIIETSRKLLSKTLPSYMVPEIWLAIETMPITNSGKIGRTTLAQWLHGIQTDTAATHRDCPEASTPREETTPANDAEAVIQEIWAYVLNLPQLSVGLDRSFQSLGGDSITAMQVIGRCRSRDLQISIRDVMKGDTIRKIAALASHSLSETWAPEQPHTPFPLSPIQQMYVRHKPSKSHYFNQSCVLRLKRRFDPNEIRQSIEAIIDRHSMLRARLIKSDTGDNQQIITGSPKGSFSFGVHNVLSQQEANEIIQQSQSTVDVEFGPVVAADMICITDQTQLLSIAISHFSIDIVSWQIILEDLESYLQSQNLPTARSMPFQAWCREQVDHGKLNWTPQRVLPYPLPSEDLNYWQFLDSQNTYGNTTTRQFHLPKEDTTNIFEYANTESAFEPLDLFLASLFLSFAKCFPDRSLPLIHNEGHGREPWRLGQDISRTVGWFSILTPLVVESSCKDDIWNVACRVHHIRSKILHGGMPFFASRCTNPEGIRAFDHTGPAEVVFNYMGITQHEKDDNPLFDLLAESRGESGDHASPNMNRFSIFEISAEIRDGQAHFSFVWPQGLKHADRVQNWVDECNATLTLASNTLSLSGRPSLPSCELSQMPVDYDVTRAILKHAEEKLPRGTCITMLSPTSPIQKAMLVSQAAGNDCYNTRLALSVTSPAGSVDSSKLATAWKAVVRRHPILRTVFVQRPNCTSEFYQVVLDHIEPQIEHIVKDTYVQDPLSVPKAQWHQYEAQHKLTIIQGTDSQVTVLLECSHALIDHASLRILFRDITDAYSGLEARADAIPYGDFTASIQQTSSQRESAFWHNLFASNPSGHLSEPIPSSSLPAVLRHTAVPLSQSLSSKLQYFCQESLYTPSVVFRLAWALLLSNHLEVPNVAFGYVVSGRDIEVPGIEDIVGPCLSILACVTSIDVDSTVAACLEALQAQFLESLKHQHGFLDFAEDEASIKETTDDRRKTASLPTTNKFDTLVNFRRHTDEPTPAAPTENSIDAGKPSLDFNPISERDPFDYPLVLEIDHRVSGEFDVVFTHWTNAISTTLATTLADEFADLVSKIVKEDRIRDILEG